MTPSISLANSGPKKKSNFLGLSMSTNSLVVIITISDHIRKPDYALSSEPDTRLIPRDPVIWTEVEIIKIREACQLARQE